MFQMAGEHARHGAGPFSSVNWNIVMFHAQTSGPLAVVSLTRGLRG
jgi:hypothetical protein